MPSWKLFVLGAWAVLCVADTRPRSDPSEYKAHESRDGVTIAAEIVPPDQVKNIFAASLTKRYIVVEAAAYLSAGPDIDMGPLDFLLRCGVNDTVRAANPRAIPHATKGRSMPHPGGVDIYPSGEIGYESGPYGRGVTGGVGVGVATGGPGVNMPPYDPSRDILEYQLEARAFPEGRVSRPVAGFLYFPAAARKQKKSACQIEFSGPSGTLRVPLQ